MTKLPTRHEISIERLAIIDRQIDSLRAKLLSWTSGERDQTSAALEQTLATLLQSRAIYERTLAEFESARIGRPAADGKVPATSAVTGGASSVAVLRRVAELRTGPGVDLQEGLATILEASMELGGAPWGMLQLHREGDGTLRIAAQRGFDDSFLSILEAADAGLDADRRRLVQAGASTVLLDAAEVPCLGGESARQVLLEAGIRTVAFVPLVDGHDELLGVLSLLFPATRAPRGDVLSALQFLAKLAAGLLEGARSQEALAASAQQLAQTFETAAVGLARFTRDMRPVMANAAYARLNGLPREGIVGWQLPELLGAEAFEATRIHVERVLRGVWVEYEIEVRDAPGRTRWLHVTNAPWTDGPEVVGWLATVVDITERRIAEAALKVANRRSDGLLDLLSKAQAELDTVKRHITQEFIDLESLYAVAQVGLTSFDRSLRCTRISRRMAEINGVSEEASLGRHLREYIPGPLADHAEPLLRRVLDSGAPILGVEVTGQTQAGAQRNWRVNYSPVRAVNGDVAGVTVAVLDVTA